MYILKHFFKSPRSPKFEILLGLQARPKIIIIFLIFELHATLDKSLLNEN